MNSLQDTIEQLYQHIHDVSLRYRLILLHPNHPARSLVLARLLDDNERTPTFYYALSAQDINLFTFLENLARALFLQNGRFGWHLNEKMLHPLSDEASLQEHSLLLDAFVHELEALADMPFFLIFDDYDYADGTDDINAFVNQLSRRLPPQCTLIINSRTLPHLPLLALLASQRGALIYEPNADVKGLYKPLVEPPYDVEVYGLGQGSVVVHDETITQWEGHLPRLLLFYMLDRAVVTRTEICRAFWSNLSMEQATNVFHVTKRRLHKATKEEVLVHHDNRYYTNPALNIYYDVDAFVACLLRGRNSTNPDEALENWQRAESLYNGGFLQGNYQERWLLERREDFQHGYLESLYESARIWLRKERPELAVKALQKAVEVNNKRQDLQRALLHLYAQLGRRSEVVEHFQKMKQAYQLSGHQIEDETAQLFQSLLE
jgi:DNA-binding SARP family transcriptional activator